MFPDLDWSDVISSLSKLLSIDISVEIAPGLSSFLDKVISALKKTGGSAGSAPKPMTNSFQVTTRSTFFVISWHLVVFTF